MRIGLLWHTAASGNLGVGALTLANIALVRQVAHELGLAPTFVIIGMRGESNDTYVDDPDVEVFSLDGKNLIHPSGCWSLFGRLDLIIDIGAGDSFADIYGATRFFFLWWTKMLASWRSRPLLMAPQTIGPFTRTPYRQLARVALSRAEAVIARDEVSLEAIKTLAPRVRRVLSADVAFALPYRDQSALRGGPRLRVGVNVSGLLDSEARSGRNRFGLQADYAVLMRRCLAALCAREEVEVHLVSHVRSDNEAPDNDEPVAQGLALEFPQAKLAPRFRDPVDAKSFISGLDFLIAARMHACIAALSTGVPVVPIAYSRKFVGLFGMLDYGWTLPMRGYDTDAAVDYVLDCLARRAELAVDAVKAGAKAQSLLDGYRTELRRFLRSTPR
jgi:colanic acid/amylovoran biosynthesis protein